jgi:hypothetical protein
MMILIRKKATMGQSRGRFLKGTTLLLMKFLQEI